MRQESHKKFSKKKGGRKASQTARGSAKVIPFKKKEPEINLNVERVFKKFVEGLADHAELTGHLFISIQADDFGRLKAKLNTHPFASHIHVAYKEIILEITSC